MDRERYFNLTAVLSGLSKELIIDTIDDRRPLPSEDLLYVLFNITPDYKFLRDNPYFKASNKNKYKTECKEYILHFLTKRYENWFNRKNETSGKIIIQSLFENNQSNNDLFNIPEEMIARYKTKKNNLQDGKIILADILNYWLTTLIKNEIPEEYKGPKTIEIQAQKTNKVVSAVSTTYTGDYPELDYDIYDNDIYDDSERDRYIDDDGSNYSFNEEHEK